MVSDVEIAVRLFMSALFAGLIGYERESRYKAAGLRTHMLVSIGSCLIMVLSLNIYGSVQGFTNADPARLAAQVVSGIGFLGAGSIIKEGPTVRGLTTAAGLWVVAGIGLAIGAGYYVSSLITTILVMLTLTFVARIEEKFHQEHIAAIVVTTIDAPGQLAKISTLFARYAINIRDIKMEESNHVLHITFFVKSSSEVDLGEVRISIANLDGVFSVKMA